LIHLRQYMLAWRCMRIGREDDVGYLPPPLTGGQIGMIRMKQYSEFGFQAVEMEICLRNMAGHRVHHRGITSRGETKIEESKLPYLFQVLGPRRLCPLKRQWSHLSFTWTVITSFAFPGLRRKIVLLSYCAGNFRTLKAILNPNSLKHRSCESGQFDRGRFAHDIRDMTT
jgi:hypothetical protein